ncbi:uncharacterized protein LOC121049836 [Rosa chinensis]|uniref:uncharacterized protein LOC121049836 n=1 Tax=Rosa chinensis TaxID=74649 RepID=UPI001AD8F867|nr:uncharacterized protein LOC121049836 [Rosa chinensis]
MLSDLSLRHFDSSLKLSLSQSLSLSILETLSHFTLSVSFDANTAECSSANTVATSNLSPPVHLSGLRAPPSGSRWGPQLDQATYKNCQRLYLSEQLSNLGLQLQSTYHSSMKKHALLL